jgi:hypothetical protein
MSSDFSRNENYYEELNKDAPDLEQSVLDDVLKATMSSDEALLQINERSHQAFLKVARQYTGQELTLDPVAIALVQAVLAETLNGRIVSEDRHAIMASEIAESLVTNPTASARLAAFWNKLQEAVT